MDITKSLGPIATVGSKLLVGDLGGVTGPFFLGWALEALGLGVVIVLSADYLVSVASHHKSPKEGPRRLGVSLVVATLVLSFAQTMIDLYRGYHIFGTNFTNITAFLQPDPLYVVSPTLGIICAVITQLFLLRRTIRFVTSLAHLWPVLCCRPVKWGFGVIMSLAVLFAAAEGISTSATITISGGLASLGMMDLQVTKSFQLRMSAWLGTSVAVDCVLCSALCAELWWARRKLSMKGTTMQEFMTRLILITFHGGFAMTTLQIACMLLYYYVPNTSWAYFPMTFLPKIYNITLILSLTLPQHTANNAPSHIISLPTIAMSVPGNNPPPASAYEPASAMNRYPFHGIETGTPPSDLGLPVAHAVNRTGSLQNSSSNTSSGASQAQSPWPTIRAFNLGTKVERVDSKEQDPRTKVSAKPTSQPSRSAPDPNARWSDLFRTSWRMSQSILRWSLMSEAEHSAVSLSRAASKELSKEADDGMAGGRDGNPFASPGRGTEKRNHGETGKGVELDAARDWKTRAYGLRALSPLTLGSGKDRRSARRPSTAPEAREPRDRRPSLMPLMQSSPTSASPPSDLSPASPPTRGLAKRPDTSDTSSPALSTLNWASPTTPVRAAFNRSSNPFPTSTISSNISSSSGTTRFCTVRRESVPALSNLHLPIFDVPPASLPSPLGGYVKVAATAYVPPQPSDDNIAPHIQRCPAARPPRAAGVNAGSSTPPRGCRIPDRGEGQHPSWVSPRQPSPDSDPLSNSRNAYSDSRPPSHSRTIHPLSHRSSSAQAHENLQAIGNSQADALFNFDIVNPFAAAPIPGTGSGPNPASVTPTAGRSAPMSGHRTKAVSNLPRFRHLLASDPLSEQGTQAQHRSRRGPLEVGPSGNVGKGEDGMLSFMDFISDGSR